MTRFAFLFVLMALIQGIATPVARAETVVIRAGGYLDVEKGRLISPATVVVEDGRITAVNPKSVPGDARAIDLGKLILLPGLMDMHTHLTLDIEGDWVNVPVKTLPADWALRGARNARRTLHAGFTTVREAGAGGFTDVSLMHAIDRDFIPGPRIIPVGHALSITGGHCEVTGFSPGILEAGPRQGVADGVAEVLKAVRYQIKHGAKAIKICATAGVLSFEGPVGAQQYSEEEMRAIAEEAHRHGVIVAAHAHGSAGILAAVRAGIDTIEHGSILTDEILDLMKQKGTYLVPQLYLLESIDRDSLPPPILAKFDDLAPRMRDSFGLALKSGVKIAFGTDSGVFPHGDNAKELTARVEQGMSPIETIRGATIHAADLLGVDDRGAIKAGLLADIIAVDGDPLKDITVLEDVRFVMKGGAVYKSP